MNAEPRIVELDVREQLRNKLEPFQLIMDAVKSLDKEDTFILHATFKPRPLLGLLKVKGFRNTVKQEAKDHWIVTFRHKHASVPLQEEDAADEEGAAAHDFGNVHELDNRGLQPPSPMVRTLQLLERIQPGETVRIHNDRVPAFLIEELQTLGYPFQVEEQPDGSAKVTIHKSH